MRNIAQTCTVLPISDSVQVQAESNPTMTLSSQVMGIICPLKETRSNEVELEHPLAQQWVYAERSPPYRPGLQANTSSGRVCIMNTQAQWSPLHTWIILVNAKQHLVQIDRIDGPTAYLSYMLTGIRFCNTLLLRREVVFRGARCARLPLQPLLSALSVTFMGAVHHVLTSVYYER